MNKEITNNYQQSTNYKLKIDKTQQTQTKQLTKQLTESKKTINNKRQTLN